MPTLLQINVVVNWGSTGRIAEEIGQVAMAAGWRSVIAYGRGNPTSKSELIRIGSNMDMYLHGIESRLFDNHGLASRKATRVFIEQIKALKPDVIHLHNIHGYYINYKLLFNYLAESKIPVVWTLHDCWSFTGHCAYFTFAKCDKWKTECYNCKLKKSYPFSLLFDCSKSNYVEKKQCFTTIGNLTMVPVSEWLAGLVKHSFFKGKRIECIHNGVDTHVFAPQTDYEDFRKQLQIEQRKLILGVASIWNKRKGLQDFIKLRSVLPIEKYAIILVGLSVGQVKELPEGLLGVMRTNNVKELAVYYAAADVFVNPTYEDNFPTTNLEALACGTPVITYRTGGSPEAVTPETGRVIDPGNLQALAETIVEITSQGKQAYTAACRQRAVDHFDKWERWKEYIEVYEQIICP